MQVRKNRAKSWFKYSLYKVKKKNKFSVPRFIELCLRARNLHSVCTKAIRNMRFQPEQEVKKEKAKDKC